MPIPRNYIVALEYHVALARYEEDSQGTTEASSSRPDRQRPIASTRRHRVARLALQEDQPQHGPPDHFEDTTEVEDVAATHDSNVDSKVENVATTHDSNVEVDAEPTEPSREREPLRCMSKTSTLHEWNWWAYLKNGPEQA
ncbi:unnamed protein product [Prunus armeniaca]